MTCYASGRTQPPALARAHGRAQLLGHVLVPTIYTTIYTT